MKRSYSAQKNDEEKYEWREIHYSLRPSYYDDFHCIAQNCKMTCCAGWEITMNRKDYLNLRKQKGSEELNEIIKQSVHKRKNNQEEDLYAEIRRSKDGFCPIISKDHLCQLQIECGYEALPYVCQTFPRKKVFTNAGYLERSLSLGCEAVLELLWNQHSSIDFVEEPLPKTEWKKRKIEKTSPSIYFGEIRLLCMDLLQDRRFPVAQRIMLLGFLLQKMPETAEDVPAWFVESKRLLELPDIAQTAASFIPTDQESLMKCIFQNIQTLMVIESTSSNLLLDEKAYINQLLADEKLQKRKEKTDRTSDTKTDLHDEQVSVTIDMETYQQAKQNFLHTFGDLEYFFENLAVSIFYGSTLPDVSSKKELWKDYVNFCNIYSLFRFVSIASCKSIVQNQKEAVFKGIILSARAILHSEGRRNYICDTFFKNDSSSLAHMAILLSQ